VVNTRKIVGRALDRYQAQAAQPVENDLKNLKRLGLKVRGVDLVRMSAEKAPGMIRHDPTALGAVVVELALEGRRARRKLTS
jgi:hypothetical protein